MKPGPPVCDGLLQRDFTATNINHTWLTDITVSLHRSGELYRCAIKDACSGRLFGYALDLGMKSRSAVAVLKDAVAGRGALKVTGCVVHSDRGSQSGSCELQQVLRHHALAGSMGGSGPPETRRRWRASSPPCRRTCSTAATGTTRDELCMAIIHWIERTYHRRRRQSRLGSLTPAEYATFHQHAVATAA